MGVKAFNETHITNFSRPQPVPKVLRVLKQWMGTGHVVLDVGCGSGFYSYICRERGNHVIGVDITSQVRAARALGIEVCMGNAELGLPFKAQHFSMVLCIEVIEHLLEPERVLEEIHRVLRPEGALIVTTPNYAYWVLRLLYLFGRLPVGLPSAHFNGWFTRVPTQSVPPWREPHIRFFTPHSLKQLLDACGFVSESSCSTFVAFPSGIAPHLPFALGLPLRVAGKLIGNLNFLGDYFPSLLAAGLMVKARKT
jgi:methionine biosynthesis protein MetW